MSGRLVRFIAKLIPISVRYYIIWDEYVRTPKGQHTAGGTSLETVLRNMKERSNSLMENTMGLYRGPNGKYVHAVKLDENTAPMAVKWCQGVLVEERDAEDPENTYVGMNVPTPAGIKRASEGAWIVQHESSYFTVVGLHEFESQYTRI